MNRYIDDFITTLTTNRQERVGAILAEAILAKSQLDLIATRLQDLQNASPAILRQAIGGGVITSGDFILNLRDVWLRIQDLYTLSNSISALLDSHSSVLGSDVKLLSSQLDGLEKMAQNYGFLLADGGSYGFAYLEPFNDERGRETALSFNIPDRANQVFGPVEQAIVRQNEGVLALIDTIDNPYSLSARIVKGNATASIISDTGIANTLNANSTTGWKVSIGSSTPITSSLTEANGVTGAQFLVEFQLSKPSAANQITLVPFADMAMDILQVTIFTSPNDDSTGTNLLTDSTPMDRDLTLHFPMQSVSRFRLLLNQSIYNRFGVSIHPAENQYQTILNTITTRKKQNHHVGSRRHFLHTLRILEIIKVLRGRRVDPHKVIIGLPQIDFDINWGPLRFDKLLLKDNNQKNDDWVNDDSLADFLTRVFKNHLVTFNMFGRSVDRFEDVYSEVSPHNKSLVTFINDDFRKVNFTQGPRFNLANAANFGDPVIMRREYIQPRDISTTILTLDPPSPVGPTSSVISYQYEYNLGLKYVSIGAQSLGFKGQFVSQIMPATGDIGEVRLKTSEQNYRDVSISRDSSLFTSVEYSVSNVSEPIHEEDWIPIASIDQAGILVEGERFFPDIAGNGFFRFPASLADNINIYKNGFRIKNLDFNTAFIFDVNKQSIVGLNLPTGTYTSSDFFTVDYTPAGDYSTVNFDTNNVIPSYDLSISTDTPAVVTNIGNKNPPLVSAHDNTGAGESFAGSGDRNTVDILHTPYIDYDAVNASSYSDTSGLNPYQPITVILSDGNTAINLTNYIPGGIQATLPDSSAGVYYINSGNTLMFNQSVSQSFRVYYQYLQNNVRVRVVLRCNDGNFVSPTVDFFHLKAKTHNDVRSS